MAISINPWQIELMTSSSEADYQSLVEKASGSPLSYTLTWRDILLDLGMGEPFYWLAYQGLKLLGALPAFVRWTDMGAVLNSLPFVQSTGGVISDPNLDHATRSSLVKVLIGEVLNWCRVSNIGTACIIGSAFIEQQDEKSFPEAPDFHIQRIIQALDLTKALNFPKVVRWMVKKAESFGPVLKKASSLDDARIVYDLYAANMRQMGVLPHDWNLYESLFKRATGDDCAHFVWAEVENKPVAGLILMRHGDIVDYYSVGSTEFGRQEQMNSWLCAQQMRAAKADGVRWWNWMASPTKQVQDFKAQWGSVKKTYPIWLWRLGDISAWLRLSPAELSMHFPGYFVLPYDWLASKEESAVNARREKDYG